jgi:hypothetical protein
MDQKTAIGFVTEAELPETKDLAAFDIEPVKFDPERDQSVVVGPQLFSFVKGVTQERRQAVANSALFASLVADAKVPRSSVEEWTSLYSGALTKLGWVLQESSKREFDQARVSSQVHESIIEVVAAIGIGGTALILIKAALTAIQKASDNAKWFTLFDRQTRREKISGFQVGLVDNTDSGAFQVKLIGFNLQLSKAATQILILKFGSGAIHMDTVANTYTIAEDVLTPAMPDLVQRLSKYVRSYVADVDLPPVS